MDNRVVIMETGLIAPGGPTWISGNPANLAGNASVNCLFDLGPDWMDYTMLQVVIRSQGPSTGLINITATSRDNPVAAVNGNRYLKEMYNTATSILYASVLTSNAAGCINLRPMGRYLVINMTNGDATNAIGSQAGIAIAGYTS